MKLHVIYIVYISALALEYSIRIKQTLAAGNEIKLCANTRFSPIDWLHIVMYALDVINCYCDSFTWGFLLFTQAHASENSICEKQ